MSARKVVAIHVWRSHHCETDYSISLVDAKGEEVRCIGGDNETDVAWAMARDEADERGIPAMLMPDESGRITSTYEPEVQS